MATSGMLALQIIMIAYIVFALMVITLFTLCVIALSAKIKFCKNMNRFIDDNKDRVSSIITNLAEKNG